MVDDFSVAEGDISSTDDRHRLSPAERATVGDRGDRGASKAPSPKVTHRPWTAATGCRPEGNCRILRADAHKKRSQPH